MPSQNLLFFWTFYVLTMEINLKLVKVIEGCPIFSTVKLKGGWIVLVQDDNWPKTVTKEGAKYRIRRSYY